MRWLMLALLVSLGALLFAAAGVAHHIRLQRNRLRSKPVMRPHPAPGQTPDQTLDLAEEIDHEIER
jgi:hypothetical protein